MNSKELINKLKEIEEKQKELKYEIRSLEKLKEDIYGHLNRYAVFDESIVVLISQLMSKKENREYIPFIYRTISIPFVDSKSDIESKYVGITDKNNIERFIESTDAEELFKDKLGYEVFFRDSDVRRNQQDRNNAFVDYYEIPKKKDRTLITFEFLLDGFGAAKHGYPVRVSKYNFEDYTYVQDFVKYLFELQIKNNGSRLMYEQMNASLNEFLELEKGIPKQKIKEKDKS